VQRWAAAIPPADARSGKVLAGVIIALAGVLLVWARLLPLTHGLWNDEAYSALNYIVPGPAGVFGTYTPNDHMLFELLTWATARAIGDSSEPVLRLWGIIPAIAAAVVMTWWLWRRLGAWVAAMFSVLAAAGPVYLVLSSQARGYGLAFLAGTVVVIATDAYAWLGRPRDLVLLGAGAIVGIWTLPVFVLAFLPLAGLLLTRPHLRLAVVRMVVIVGLASILFYLPVLGDLFGSANQKFGMQLPWYGVVTFPLDDHLSPTVVLLAHGASLHVTEVIAGALVLAGFVILWRRPERYLAVALIAPTIFTYLVLEVARFYSAARFVSFLELPLFALCAVALAQAGALIARLPLGRYAAAACAIAFSLFVFRQAEHSASSAGQVPIENFKEVAALVKSSKIATVESNSTKPAGFDYYLGDGRVSFLKPSILQARFCTQPAPFIYIEHGLSPLPDTSCLRQRRALSIGLPQSRSYLNVWFVDRK
jgi:hypothetical protein